MSRISWSVSLQVAAAAVRVLSAWDRGEVQGGSSHSTCIAWCDVRGLHARGGRKDAPLAELVSRHHHVADEPSGRHPRRLLLPGQRQLLRHVHHQRFARPAWSCQAWHRSIRWTACLLPAPRRLGPSQARNPRVAGGACTHTQHARSPPRAGKGVTRGGSPDRLGKPCEGQVQVGHVEKTVQQLRKEARHGPHLIGRHLAPDGHLRAGRGRSHVGVRSPRRGLTAGVVHGRRTPARSVQRSIGAPGGRRPGPWLTCRRATAPPHPPARPSPAHKHAPTRPPTSLP